MTPLQQYYRAAADTLFKASMVNDPEDTDALLRVCRRLMDDNGIIYNEDTDDWLEFAYRAGEICELSENGYCYRWVDNPDKPGGKEYRLEAISPLDK